MKNIIQKALKKIGAIIRPEAEAGKKAQRKVRKEDRITREGVGLSPRMTSDKDGHSRRSRSSRRRGGRRPGGESVTAPPGDAKDKGWRLSQFKVPEVEDKTRFHDFDLPQPLMHAISDAIAVPPK